MYHHLPSPRLQADLSGSSLSQLIQSYCQLIFQSRNSAFHLGHTGRFLRGSLATCWSGFLFAFLGYNRFSLSVSKVSVFSRNLTYLDAVQVGFASSLKIGMRKFPDVLLDLTGIVVDVLDLDCQHRTTPS
jgi:hypothetical protein